LGAIVRQTYWAGRLGGRNSLDSAGRLLAYVKYRANEGEIWVKDLQTGQERHLVTTVPLNPVISPDGTTVAYSVDEGDGATGHVVPTSGGAARRVCDRCTLFGWLGDNRHVVALESRGGTSRHALVVDVIDGGSRDLIVESTAGIGRLDVSPDSRWISFHTARQVWMAPLRPGDPPPESQWVAVHRVAENSAERACGWSPDGRLLYLLLERDGFRDLYAQRIDPSRGVPVGEPFIVQHLHDPRRRWGSTPFGNAIVSNAFVFSQVESTGTIWMMAPVQSRVERASGVADER
jgi:hypothetical protein